MVNQIKPATELFDFSFSENGLTAFKLGQPLSSQVANLI